MAADESTSVWVLSGLLATPKTTISGAKERRNAERPGRTPRGRCDAGPRVNVRVFNGP